MKKKKPVDYTKKALTFLRSHFRRCWMYYSENRKKALEAAKRDNKYKKVKNFKWKKLKNLYECNTCNNDFPLKEVQVDHVNKIGALSYGNLGDWVINLMFGDQVVMCKTCHQTKTNKDRKSK